MKSYLSFDTEAKLKKSKELPPHIHFIGIGGIGMSAIAMILAKHGYSISGSDQKKSSALKELERNKVHIFQTQQASNIDEILKIHGKNILIVRSSAIREENIELCKAQKWTLMKIPIKMSSGDIQKIHGKNLKGLRQVIFLCRNTQTIKK